VSISLTIKRVLHRKILNSEKNAHSGCEKRVARQESERIIRIEKRAAPGQHKNISRPTRRGAFE